MTSRPLTRLQFPKFLRSGRVWGGRGYARRIHYALRHQPSVAVSRSVLRAILVTALLVAVIPQNAAAQRGRRDAASADTAKTATKAEQIARAARSLKFRAIGPAAISGRIQDIAIHPGAPNTWYIAVASGGVWKTENAGTTWEPIMDDVGSYSFGCVTIDPNDPNVVWVGSGENNIQRSVSWGDGVYKSVDAGRTWKNMGLKESEHIAKILVDPRDSDVVYVAAQGPLWRKGPERGIYKTTDGGGTWTQILPAVNDWTGVADLVMDPSNPDVLIASSWQRARRQWTLISGGPGSKLWRTEDGGATWTEAKGMPGGDVGRIGLAISPVDPDVVYAIAQTSGESGGFFRSTNNGRTFRKMSDRMTSGNYYQELFADPVHVDRVYSVNTVTGVTNDGGRTWENVPLQWRHVDDHVVWVNPQNPDHLLIGGDGGLYQSWDLGQTWDWFQNLPLAQFYRVEVDSLRPYYRIYGGTQDNNTFGGPSNRGTSRGARNSDWFQTQGGDGFVTRVDPTDPNIVYSESQHAGISRFNLSTGEDVYIQPMEEPGEDKLRWHWDTPIVISPHDPARLYIAAQRVFRSDDRGSSWRPVSGDLSAGIDRDRLRIMGRVWSVDAVEKNGSTSEYGAVVALSESPLREGLLWAGTDDGEIHITEDGGGTWRRIGPVPGVPDTTFVYTLNPSHFDANTVYASWDPHKEGDFRPYVAVSRDLGRTWKLITHGLPERGTAWTIKEDPEMRGLLYVGTEYGIWFSPDDGASWARLGSGVPTIRVMDLAIQTQDDDLVLGTFGRGFYVLDDLEILRALVRDAAVLDAPAAVLPVTRAPLFVPASPDNGSEGARFWTAADRPTGAQIFYWLKEAPTTRKARRQKAEAALQKEGKDTFYPPWDSLDAEDREEAPSMLLTIKDASGAVVRRLTGPASSGLSRVAWDLRYPSLAPVTGAAGGGRRGGGGSGPLVAPGTYTVSLALVHDGETRDLGVSGTIEVYPMHGPRSAEAVAFQLETAALMRTMYGANAALTEAKSRLVALREAVGRVPADNAALLSDLDRLEDDLDAVGEELSGERTRAPRGPSLMQRLSRSMGSWNGTINEVTGLQRRQFEIVSTAYPPIRDRIETLVGGTLPALEARAEAAGAPWTPGRKVPGLR